MRGLYALFIGYFALLVSAMALTSVGAFEFFGYLLSPGLALAATVVFAVGLPLLKIADMNQSPDAGKHMTAIRWLLYAVLALELVAQYFKAQSSFTKTVLSHAGVLGSDLALAATNPYTSRLVSFLMLASLPALVYIVTGELYKTAQRMPIMRGAIANLNQTLAELRQTLAERNQAHAELAQEHAELAQRLATTQATLAESESTIHALGGSNAQLESRHAQDVATIAELRSILAQAAEQANAPRLTLASAIELLVDLGAPRSTIQHWMTTKRLNQPNEPTE